MRWTVLIPAKALPEAKTRLAGASADATAHRELVEAIRADTASAARAAANVARVVLVTDHPADVPDPLIFVQRAPGLNAALTEAAADAAARWPADGVAALVGDLPALRAVELSAALDAAAQHARAFVADAPGSGTTMLTALPGHALTPQFGAGSAARHGRLAAPLPARPGLRQDVDTAADLDAALELGVGAATLRALRDTRDSPARGMMTG